MSAFSEAAFKEALARPRLSRPAPEFLNSNRLEPIRARSEPELQAMTEEWFTEFAVKLDYLSKVHDTDLSWLMTWAQKYWWSFLVRDMSINDELYAQDVEYTDVVAFGHTMRGIDEFVKYNFAFFDAIPDWRYDPLPGQAYVDVEPDGSVRIVIRYIGSGHFSGHLRMHPFDGTAPKMYGDGRFVQCPAVDRYHFNSEHKMQVGETLYDFIDVTQRLGILPRGDSWQFRSIAKASKLQVAARGLTAKLRSGGK